MSKQKISYDGDFVDGKFVVTQQITEQREVGIFFPAAFDEVRESAASSLKIDKSAIKDEHIAQAIIMAMSNGQYETTTFEISKIVERIIKSELHGKIQKIPLSGAAAMIVGAPKYHWQIVDCYKDSMNLPEWTSKTWDELIAIAQEREKCAEITKKVGRIFEACGHLKAAATFALLAVDRIGERLNAPHNEVHLFETFKAAEALARHLSESLCEIDPQTYNPVLARVANNPQHYVKRGDHVVTNDAIYQNRGTGPNFSNLEADERGYVTAQETTEPDNHHTQAFKGSQDDTTSPQANATPSADVDP